MDKYINCCVLSYDGKHKSDTETYGKILGMLGIKPSETLLVGDRLDKHVYLANILGMISIRVCNTIFKLQEPANQNEIPKLNINGLNELNVTDYVHRKF
jgi:FMN phosphatase YigB (HAD superfamily)